MDLRNFWHKLLHSPDLVFEYKRAKEDIYNILKEDLRELVENGKIYMETNDKTRTIRIWRIRGSNNIIPQF